jgi:hypothetical protein
MNGICHLPSTSAKASVDRSAVFWHFVPSFIVIWRFRAVIRFAVIYSNLALRAVISPSGVIHSNLALTGRN